MKPENARRFEWLPAALAAVAFLGALAVFGWLLNCFWIDVGTWARRDLRSQAELAADSLREPLASQNFRALTGLHTSLEAKGLILRVRSANGGWIFHGGYKGATVEEYVPCGEYSVGVAIREEQVYAPFYEALVGFVLAALVGVLGMFVVFFILYRQRVRIRELAKLEKFRREFIADVSHEIKTPLTGILGCVELLQGGDALPSDQRSRLLAMLKTESTRLNTLAQGILSLAKLEHSGETSIALEASDLSSIATTAIERTQTKAEAAGVKLTLSVPTDPVNVRCNPGLVEEAVVNLIENALRHSQSPEVIVTVKANALTVEDHGIGLSAEDKPHVFERFWRADASRTSDTGGSGLGLAIVKEIVRVNDADITLDTQPGRGCRFTITFAKAR